MAVNYPTSVPLDSITKIWTIIRSGQAKEQMDELAFHAWNVQGYLFSVIFGDPNKVSSADSLVAAEAAAVALDEALNQISIHWSELCKADNAQKIASSGN